MPIDVSEEMNLDLAQFRADLLTTYAAISRQQQEPQPATPEPAAAWTSHLASLDKALENATHKACRGAHEALEHHLSNHPASPLTGSTSLFRGIGFRRDEVAHTQAFAWLLDPTAQHGFGLAPLRQLLSALKKNAEASNPALAAISRGLMEPDPVSVYAEWPLSSSCRIDVLVQGGSPASPSWQILIEAKIDAEEREDQLADYQEHCKPAESNGANNTVAVFLTPTGHLPVSSANPGEWITLSFLQWARGMISLLADHADKPGAPFLRTYLTGVLEDVLEMSCQGDAATIVRNSNPIRIEQLLGDS